MENKKISRIKFYLCYSVLFAILCLACFVLFIINEKTFVWEYDGINQHYVALLYYARYLRSIIKNILFNHSLSLPAYSLSIGYGSDIITSLSYYVVGDPIAFLSVFVPMRFMTLFYNGAIILRLYLAGIAFSAYCFYRRESENGVADITRSSILAGTLIYVFCGYAFYGCIRHPYFANPMIYLPMILLGVEKIIDRKRPYIFVFGVFLEAISNFYFFYMVVMVTIVYVAVRLIYIHGLRNIKNIVLDILRIGIYAVLGTGMSSVVLVPTINYFLQIPRKDIVIQYSPIYMLTEYLTLFRDFLTPNTGITWRFLGYASIVLISIFALFTERKKHRDLKFIIVFWTIGLMIPVFNSFMNGGSYPVARWSWGYGFFVAFSVVIMWRKILDFSKKKLFSVGIFLSAYLVICMVFTDVWSKSIFFAMAMAFGYLLVIHQIRLEMFPAKKGEILLIFMICFNVFGLSFLHYSPYGGNQSQEFLTYSEVYDIVYHGETKVLDKYIDKETEEFSRYQGDVTKNGTLNSGYSNTQYFWSLSDGNITKFQRMTKVLSTVNQNYLNLDNRTILSTLANAKYWIRNTNWMYGYKQVGTARNYKDSYDFMKKYAGIVYKDGELTDQDKSDIAPYIRKYTLWENEYTLPFGYTYEKSVSEDSAEKMSATDFQETMLQAVVTDDVNAETEEDIVYTNKTFDYEMEIGKGITYKDGTFTVNEENAEVTFTFSGIGNSETYLELKGIQYGSISPKDRYSDVQWKLLTGAARNRLRYASLNYVGETFVDYLFECEDEKSNVKERSLEYKTPYYSFYNGASDYIINFGYNENASKKIKMIFTEVGKYSFDDIEIHCQPMDNYSEQVSALKENTLENVDMHSDTVFNATNLITGDITLEKSKYLLLTIPYSKGWKAYIDGVETKTYKGNIMFTMIPLEKGEHHIVLKYETPYLKLGAFVSVLCFVIIVITAIRMRRKEGRKVEE